MFKKFLVQIRASLHNVALYVLNVWKRVGLFFLVLRHITYRKFVEPKVYHFDGPSDHVIDGWDKFFQGYYDKRSYEGFVWSRLGGSTTPDGLRRVSGLHIKKYIDAGNLEELRQKNLVTLQLQKNLEEVADSIEYPWLYRECMPNHPILDDHVDSSFRDGEDFVVKLDTGCELRTLSPILLIETEESIQVE